METLKSIDELFEPDERWSHFVMRDKATNEVTPYSLEQRFQAVAEISLSSTAPEDVISHFNVARMLCVYAWLYYPLHQVAELKAFSTVEMALRNRFPGNKGGLFKLLTLAVEQGIIADAGFSHIEATPEVLDQYSKRLPGLVSSLRNTLAHGESMLHPGSLFTLRNCAEIINQLFPEAKLA